MTRPTLSRRAALALAGALLVAGAVALPPVARVLTGAVVRSADAAAAAGAALRPVRPAGFRTCFVRQAMDYSGPAPRRVPQTVCETAP